MKKLLYITAVFSMMALYSCKEDFNVAAPYKQITTVYGMLNMDDTAHYIRIQKAFLDEEKNAFEMAKVSDSSFYKDLTVTLLEYNEQKTSVRNTYTLTKVNANDEGYQKEEPTSDLQKFFTDPNFAYKFTDKIDHKYFYQLIIKNNETGTSDSSNLIGVINTSTESQDLGFAISAFQLKTYQLRFSTTRPTSFFRLKVGLPKNARYVEGILRFHYIDRNPVDDITENKYVDFRFDDEAGVLTPGTIFELSTLNANIYAFLSSAIGPAPENVLRYVDTCQMFVYASSPEAYYFNEINEGQAGGITADNIRPNFTTFKGDNVIGVLGSRGYRQYDSAIVHTVTLDSLKTNPATQALRFAGRESDI